MDGIANVHNVNVTVLLTRQNKGVGEANSNVNVILQIKGT